MKKFCFNSDCQKLFLRVMRLFQIPASVSLWGMTSKHLGKGQSVKPRAACVVRDMSELTLARTGAVTAEPSAMGSFPRGRHLMDILKIPGDY